ncbi:hypothetical protein MPER_03746, partial [Moniliophthora perniciosa FA553]
AGIVIRIWDESGYLRSNKQGRTQQKKDKDLIKVLLLGQSESGKSTTLKNLRMAYAKEEWLREKASWRAVIQLNLIRSISVILETLRAEIEDTPYIDELDSQSETPNSAVGRISSELAVASPVSPVSTRSGSSGVSEAYDPRVVQAALALRKRDVEEKYHDLRNRLSV